MDLFQPFMSRQAGVSRKTPAQAALPRMARDKAPYPGQDDEGFQKASTGDAGDLTEDFNDWDTSGGQCHALEVLDAEHHGNGERPCCTESDGNGAADGQRDGLFRSRDFFSHVRGAIEACERPLRVHEADDKCNPVVLPASVVDEGCKDEFGRVVTWCEAGDRDEEDCEGQE